MNANRYLSPLSTLVELNQGVGGMRKRERQVIDAVAVKLNPSVLAEAAAALRRVVLLRVVLQAQVVNARLKIFGQRDRGSSGSASQFGPHERNAGDRMAGVSKMPEPPNHPRNRCLGFAGRWWPG